jgi:uncharacterized protein (DUF1501 family)
MESTWLEGKFDELLEADREVLGELAAAYGEQARTYGSRMTSGRALATLASYSDASALLGRLRTVPAMTLESWSSDEQPSQNERGLQRLLWTLEHDLTTAAFLRILHPWDSHIDNARRQTESSPPTFALLARFLQELHRRRNRYGTLFEQTVLVVGSEIGRFPRLNSVAGKDHLPEVPLLLYGAAFERAWGQQLGATGRQLESLTVSKLTGRFERGGLELALDDFGATLLHLAGVAEVEIYGYQRPPLQCVIS